MVPVKERTPLPAVARRKTLEREPATPESGSFFHWRSVQLPALALLLTIIAAPSLLPKYSVTDPDIWLHLKVGDWVAEHRAVPYSGILSATVADRPWIAYSWFYELLLSLFHSWFHLMGVAVYGLLLTLAVASSVFWMTSRVSASFWRACLLATACCAAFLFNVLPRPVFFSMTLFALTLTLLLEARRTGNSRLLYWLPPLFVLWANVHIQFVYGLVAVGLFVTISILQTWAAAKAWVRDLLVPTPLPARTLFVVLAACVLATCIGPYSYHLYFVVFSYAASSFPFTYIHEFQALGFRNYTDFVQLLLTGFAFFVLGRRKQLDAFLLALLIVASVVGYRTQRDSWFACIPATACIAAWFDGTRRENRVTMTQRAGFAVALTLLILLYARTMDVNNQNLRFAIAGVYPVQAINYLREHPQKGPLYNTYDWGDFITWYMPEYPVAIDGRTDLYGDEIDMRFYRTENGDASYNDDPYLRQANVFLIPKQKPLSRLLASDSQFNLIYEDALAMVFVRR